MSEPQIELRDVTRTYGEGEALVRALDAVDLTIGEGDFLALAGPSGSGNLAKRVTPQSLRSRAPRPRSGCEPATVWSSSPKGAHPPGLPFVGARPASPEIGPRRRRRRRPYVAKLDSTVRI